MTERIFMGKTLYVVNTFTTKLHKSMNLLGNSGNHKAYRAI